MPAVIDITTTARCARPRDSTSVNEPFLPEVVVTVRRRDERGGPCIEPDPRPPDDGALSRPSPWPPRSPAAPRAAARRRPRATAPATAPAGATVAPSAASVAPTAASTEPFTIRVALGSTGEAVDGIFTELKAAYEAKYPGRTVEIIIQEDDVYETIGLNNLLTSRNAPDVYFEWPGARLATKVDRRLRRRPHRGGRGSAVHQPPRPGCVRGDGHRRQDVHGPLERGRHQRVLVQQGDLQRATAGRRPRPGTSSWRCAPPQGGGDHPDHRRQQGQVAHRQHRLAPGRANASATTPTWRPSAATSR